MLSKGKFVGTLVTIIFAFLILSVSVLRCATPKIAYSPMVLSEKVESNNPPAVDYLLAFPGKIGPDNPLWYAKVIRDKAWYLITFNPSKKSELNLLFADKRLNSSILLFKNNKPDLGLSTLTKAEKYLESSESIMTNDNDFYKKIGLAALKHIEVINTEILPLTPEDLRDEVIISKNSTIEVYKKVKDHMLSKGLVPPQNLFELK